MSIVPPSSRRDIRAILRAVARHKTFLLTGHERPDGDTVGCELAFASFLRKRGKKVTVANNRPIPRQLMFLKGAKDVLVTPKVAGKFDCIVVFECSGFDRTGNIVEPSQAKDVVNIDHHIHHKRFGTVNLVDYHASSNAEQIYYVMLEAKHRLTPDEAAALYTGVVTDTGRFQQENTRMSSHLVAAALIKAGLNVADVSRRIFTTREASTIQVLGRALSRLKLLKNGKLAVLSLPRRDFVETGAGEDDVDDVVNFGLMPPTVEAVIFTRDVDEGVKVSFRGKGKIDLCAVAVSLGGGGHRNAAGLIMPGPIEKATAKLVSIVGKKL